MKASRGPVIEILLTKSMSEGAFSPFTLANIMGRKAHNMLHHKGPEAPYEGPHGL